MTKSALRAMLGVALVSLATSASAALTINLNDEFSGGADPVGSPPWLRAVFTSVTGGVNLTLTSLLTGTNEFVDEWAFNLNPALNPNGLTFSFVSGTGTWAAPTISTGDNTFKADGAGFFDIEFVFDNAPPTDRFGVGDSGTWFISGITGLTENDFLFNSTTSAKGTFTSAAHVQGIATAPGSGWIGGNNGGGEDPDDPGAVPEPASLALLGIALAGLSMTRRRRR